MARVRIKDHDRRPEFSIAVAVGAAVLIWFTILLWSASTSVRAVQRGLTQVRVMYQCDEGHRFEDFANSKSLPCTETACHSRAWPIWSYQCTKHGAFLYQLRYDEDDSQRPKIKAARPVGGTWEEVQGDITCPYCERTLLPDITLRPHVSPRPPDGQPRSGGTDSKVPTTYESPSQ